MKRLLLLILAVASAIGPAFASERVCLTINSHEFDSLGASPSFLFFTPEERRSLGGGSKLVLVRGDVPAPGSDALARLVEDGYRLSVGQLGFPAFPDRVSVSFTDALIGDVGVAHVSPDGRAADIVLSRSLHSEALVAELRHQVGHLVETGFALAAPTWWREASAIWLAQKLGGEDTISSGDLGRRLVELDRSPLGGSALGAASMLWFLDSRHGGETVRRVWEELGAVGGQPAQALARVLEAQGTSLEENFETYVAWLISEARRRGVASSSRPAPEFALDVLTIPVHETITTRAPEPLGVALLRFDTRDVVGGLRLELQVEPGAAWAASALLVPYGSDVPSSRLTLTRLADGRAEVTIPTSEVAEVMVAVANLGESSRLLFSVAATADVGFPYVLDDLRATATAEGVRVSWDTAREHHVFGWQVLRTGDDGEAFRPLSVVLIPSVSAGRNLDGGEYRFLDSRVEPGHSYFYVVQAVTADGLVASTHVVSVSVR